MKSEIESALLNPTIMTMIFVIWDLGLYLFIIYRL